MRRLSIFVLVLVLLCPAVVAVWQWRVMLRDQSQDEAIRAAATRYDVDPALVKAVVWRESRFDPYARGQVGELGLMQLREIAAQEWADAEGITRFQHAHCRDPLTNTLAGTYYLAKLLTRYRHTDNPVPYALADYNAGRSNVRRWLKGASQTNSVVFIEHIGFAGTKHYVKQVMRKTERYSAMR